MYNGTLFGHKREQDTAHSAVGMSHRHRAQRDSRHRGRTVQVSFISAAYARQLHRARRQTGACQGVGE